MADNYGKLVPVDALKGLTAEEIAVTKAAVRQLALEAVIVGGERLPAAVVTEIADRPHVRAAIRARALDRMRSETLPLAVSLLHDTVAGTIGGMRGQDRLSAARTVLEYDAALAKLEKPTGIDKPPEEMSSAELRRFVALIEDELAARAIPVDAKSADCVPGLADGEPNDIDDEQELLDLLA